MSKAPPAFQFYAGDFLQGTAEMTLEELGLYIRLLCHQWIAGSIPSDPDRASSLAHTTIEVFNRVWAVVGEKFHLGPDGRLRNLRLEGTRESQRRWREGQIESGRKGGQAAQKARREASNNPSNNPSSDPSSDPSGKNQALHSSVFALQSSSSVSGLRPSRRGERKKRALLVPPQAAELAERLRERILNNNPNAKIAEHQLANWGNDARLMLEEDHRDPAVIGQVMDWCQGNSFWRSKVLSMGKLRDKFDQLWLEMQPRNGDSRGQRSKNDPDMPRRAAEDFNRRHGGRGFDPVS